MGASTMLMGQGEHPSDAGGAFFVAGSLRGRVPRALVIECARWVGGAPLFERPLPLDQPGLVLTSRGPRLHAPGESPIDWHAGFAPWRMARGREETLTAVMDLRPGAVVLDATLGLGLDALVLAARGARVLAVEHLAPVLLFTALGLHRAYPSETRRISFRRADHTDVIAALPDNTVDHVLLDPMFPPDHRGSGHNLAPLRALAGTASRRIGLINRQSGLFIRPIDALRVARRSVVLRLARGEAAPEGATVDGSKRVRYAVWRRG